MKYIEVQGKNIEDAISIGLRELGTTRDKVEIEIIKKTKLLGIFANKSITIKMTLKEHLLDYNEILESIEKTIKKMFSAIEFDITSNTEIKDSKIFVYINGQDANILIGKSGEVLDAFETILNLIISKKQKAKIKICVDIDNYKKNKAEKLKNFTKEIAEKVLKSGEDYKMKNMRASERKIVHATIEQIPNLYSFSVGYGNSRYIIITKNKPKKLIQND